MEKKLANVDREKKEDHLKQLAQKARESRIGVRSAATEGICSIFTLSNIHSLLLLLFAEEDSEAQERDHLRYDRHKERERQRRLAKAHPDKRSKLDRERDRDVTEKIALGMPSKNVSQESMFDQRLFNQSQVSWCSNLAY